MTLDEVMLCPSGSLCIIGSRLMVYLNRLFVTI